MATENQVRELIRSAYECSLDPDQWTRFMQLLATAADTWGALLIVRDLSNHHGNVGASHGIDSSYNKRYGEYYAKLNVWTQRARPFWKPGYVYGSHELINGAELEQTEFYNDFLRPLGIYYTLGTVVAEDQRTTSYIGMCRSQPGGPIGRAESEMMAQLVPHVQTALRLHHRIAGVDARLDYASSALDYIPGSLIVADASGRIVHMNRRAEVFLKSGAGLSVDASGLRAGTFDQTARLHDFIARTANTVVGNGLHPGGVFSLARSGRLPLKLQIAPLAASAAGAADRTPAVAIFVNDPEQHAAPDPVLLEALLDLSPAEARLTVALVRGKTVQQFAVESGIAVSTARTLVKRIFLKTGLSRQADLVKLALTCTGSMLPNNGEIH